MTPHGRALVPRHHPRPVIYLARAPTKLKLKPGRRLSVKGNHVIVDMASDRRRDPAGRNITICQHPKIGVGRFVAQSIDSVVRMTYIIQRQGLQTKNGELSWVTEPPRSPLCGGARCNEESTPAL